MNTIEHIREPRRLLLIWQAAEGKRSRRAVAELLRPEVGPIRLRYLTDTDDYNAALREGFFNFPAFRKTTHTYDLGVLETFMRRLPPRTRGDYAQYLEKFRLRPQTRISDFALLAYTGAKLPSDGFSMVDPLDEVSTPCEILLEVAGFRHVAQVAPTEISSGQEAQFVAEPDNSTDPHAVAVYLGPTKIGYVPCQQAPAVKHLVETGSITATVERINGRPERPMIYLFTRLRQTTFMHGPQRHAQ